MAEIDYRRMLDALADAVVAADGSNRIVYANAAAERLLGWPTAELVGRPLTAIIPHRLHEAHHQGYGRYAATRQSQFIGRTLRVPALRSDGAELDIDLTLAALRAGDEELIVASLRDQSERVVLERRLAVARQLKATAGMAARLGAGLDVDGVLGAAVATLAADFDSALARAWLLDTGAGALVLRAAAGPAGPQPGVESGYDRIPVATSPLASAQAARAGVPVVVSDLAGDARYDQAWVAREGIAALAAFPLRVGGAVRGVLVTFARGELTGEAVDALAAFVAVVAAALADVEVLAREQAARAEAERQRRKLQAILDALPLGVVLAEGTGGRMSLVNPAGRAIWGGTRDTAPMAEYAATFPVETLDGRLVADEERPLWRAAYHGERVSAVVRSRRPDGPARLLEVSATPLPGPDGGAIATFRDVTDQRRVESELFERAAQIKALLDYLPVGVAYFDGQATCRVCNGPAQRTLGGARPEVLGTTADELLAPVPGLSGALRRCLAEGAPHAERGVAWPEPDGGVPRYLDWRLEPLPTEPRGALALIVDVTDRTLADRALQESRDAAEWASRRKTQFLSAVSHDLRTPVNALSLQAELLAQLVAGPGGPDPADLRALSVDLRQAAGGLVDLINDLLDLTRFDSGAVEHHATDFALEEWLATTLGPLEPTARAKGLRCSWRVDRPGRWVRADRVKLGRVLTNLVGNAIKFTEAGSVAVTAGARADGWLALAVTDTGPGIPDDHRGRIFDAFAQLSNPERDRSKGTGLGLAICRRLVEAVGGRLMVESGPGLGSTFTALYPPDHLPASPPPTVAPTAPTPPGADPNPAPILLVEDDDHSRVPLMRLLEHAGFAVVSARDGHEALAALALARPALVLLDLMLPGLDGVAVLTHLRADPSCADLPVVILSGDVTGERVRRVRALGIAGLLTKPVDFDALRATVGRLLSPPGSSRVECDGDREVPARQGSRR